MGQGLHDKPKTCGDCANFTPEPVGRQALGQCIEERPWGTKLQWEHNQWKNTYEQKLSYPFSGACEKFKGKQ